MEFNVQDINFRLTEFSVLYFLTGILIIFTFANLWWKEGLLFVLLLVVSSYIHLLRTRMEVKRLVDEWSRVSEFLIFLFRHYIDGEGLLPDVEELSLIEGNSLAIELDGRILDLQTPSNVKISRTFRIRLQALGVNALLILIYLFKNLENCVAPKVLATHLSIPQSSVYKSINKLQGQALVNEKVRLPLTSVYEITFDGQHLVREFFESLV